MMFAGCENTTGSDDDLEIDAVVAAQAIAGWEINESVNSGRNIQELTNTSDQYEDDSILEGLNGGVLLKQQMNRMYSEMQLHFEDNSLKKTSGDSLIWYQELNREGWGFDVRKALYFNAETGRLRFYEVHFDFQEHHKLTYDSAEVSVFVGENWFEPVSEQITEMYRLQEFKSDFMLQSIESRITATEYEGDEISAVEISTISTYNPERNLDRVVRTLILNSDESGTMTEIFYFRDDTSILNSVTFRNDGTGSFAKERRDGTVITGTFNIVEDDMHGEFTENVDFPAGRYIDRIERHAIISILLPDSIFSAGLKETKYFESGKVDSASLAIQVQEIYGVKTTTMSHSKPNGAHGILVVRESDGTSVMTGHWITWDEYYIDVTAEYYIDGSGYLHYEVYQSQDAFQNEEAPLIVADYYFSADQTGSGELVYNGDTYKVTFGDEGKAEISKGEKTTVLNVY